MKLTDLRTNNLLEIISYLDCKDIIRFQLICKSFQVLLVKYKELPQQIFLKAQGLDPSPSYFPWTAILESLRTSPDTLENLFMPYYTNGGAYAKSNYYFIGNLIREKGAYCTISERNVLVKYAYSSSMAFDYEASPADYQTETDVYYLPEIEKQLDLHPEVCPYIRQINISLPNWGYTCPAKVLMCFSSVNKVEDLSMIQNFYSCVDVENAIRIANEGKVLGRHVEHADLDIVQFEQSRTQIQLLCWINYKYDVEGCKEFTVKLHHPRFARYFYLLLIANHSTGNDHNIDILTVAPYASAIQVREA